MPDEQPGKQLGPIRPGGALQTTSGAPRVVSTVVSDALSIAKTRAEKLIVIEGRQFNGDSYNQLQIWANELIVPGTASVSLAQLFSSLENMSFNAKGQWVSEEWLSSRFRRIY